ncbi:ABC transporter ATP-binding protein [Streptomyces sp. NPDC091281]|uniref:ABC transporter ATP-binding protein n=1 Tax=Streptomyces sp. NPDC091281 TaxID=3365985 RepID=UPI003816B13D
MTDIAPDVPPCPLELRNLTVSFTPPRRNKFLRRSGEEKPVRAVDGVSLRLEAGTTLALVGGSGSGKSTTAAVAARMLDCDSGTVLYGGEDVTHLDGGALRARRRHLQTVYQDPFASLQPRFTVRRTVEEGLLIHKLGATARDREERVVRALERAHVPLPLLDRLPHQLSGGQRQRVAIAAALVLEPTVLIADEPVSMLDVSLRAGVMRLFDDLRDAGTAVLLITHDLPSAARHADTIAVLQQGRLVEQGNARQVLSHPAHAYTQALLEATPRAGLRT